MKDDIHAGPGWRARVVFPDRILHLWNVVMWSAASLHSPEGDTRHLRQRWRQVFRIRHVIGGYNGDQAGYWVNSKSDGQFHMESTNE